MVLVLAHQSHFLAPLFFYLAAQFDGGSGGGWLWMCEWISLYRQLIKSIINSLGISVACIRTGRPKLQCFSWVVPLLLAGPIHSTVTCLMCYDTVTHSRYLARLGSSRVFFR